MMSMSDRLAAALGMLVTATLAQGQATVLHVDASAPPGGDGASWNTAFSDLQAALDRVAVGAPAAREFEIRVAQGTYIGHHEPRDGVGFRLLSHGASGVTLNLLGCFGGRQAADPDHRDLVSTRTVLSGDTLGDDQPNFANRTDNVGPVLWIQGFGASGVHVDGLTVRNGYCTSFGFAGGMEAGGRADNPAIFSVTHCEFVDNSTRGNGGGLAITYGVVRQSEARRNRAGFGGGIYLFTASCFECVVTTNVADAAGGIAAYDFSPTSSAFAVLSRCEIEGNSTADASGGIYARQYRIEDSLIAGNAAGRLGSGATLAASEVVSSTIVDNAGGAAGVGLLSASSENRTSWIGNSILSNNTNASGEARQVFASSTSLAGARIERCLLPVGSLEGQGDSLAMVSPIYAIPGFVNPTGPDGSASTWQDNDYHLLASSQCIDAALAPSGGHGRTQSPALDLDGVARPLGAAEDLGCFERLPACDPDFNGDGQGDQDDVAYLIQVIAGGPNPSGRDPDFNADGNVDQDDLASLVSRVAGGPCP